MDEDNWPTEPRLNDGEVADLVEMLKTNPARVSFYHLDYICSIEF